MGDVGRMAGDTVSITEKLAVGLIIAMAALIVIL
jgi:hypothetical protein